MQQSKDSESIDAPISLLDVAPQFVTGDRAFVMDAPGVGRIEVGDPLPDDIAWEHLDGDLMSISVLEPNGELTTGGGDTWGSPKFVPMVAVPASGSDPLEDGWVVGGPVPSNFETVLVRQGHVVRTQKPIRGYIAVPLSHKSGSQFEIFGQDSSGVDQKLYG